MSRLFQLECGEVTILFVLSVQKKKIMLGTPFFCSCCRSGHPDAHQALDAITEELNKLMKAWAGGDRNSDMWRRIVRMFQELVSLRHMVNMINYSCRLGVLLLMCTVKIYIYGIFSTCHLF